MHILSESGSIVLKPKQFHRRWCWTSGDMDGRERRWWLNAQMCMNVLQCSECSHCAGGSITPTVCALELVETWTRGRGGDARMLGAVLTLSLRFSNRTIYTIASQLSHSVRSSSFSPFQSGSVHFYLTFLHIRWIVLWLKPSTTTKMLQNHKIF